jgi:hypothetical protein
MSVLSAASVRSFAFWPVRNDLFMSKAKGPLGAAYAVRAVGPHGVVVSDVSGGVSGGAVVVSLGAPPPPLGAIFPSVGRWS